MRAEKIQQQPTLVLFLRKKKRVICSLGFICAKEGPVNLEIQNHLRMVSFPKEYQHLWSRFPFLWLLATCSCDVLVLTDEMGGCYLVVGHDVVIYARSLNLVLRGSSPFLTKGETEENTGGPEGMLDLKGSTGNLLLPALYLQTQGGI